jgi:hypothetical protein
MAVTLPGRRRQRKAARACESGYSSRANSADGEGGTAMISRRSVLPGLAAGAVGLHPLLAAAQSMLHAPALGDVVDAPQGRFKRPRHDRPLQDGRIARGGRTIQAAWFSDPTQRYRHFALGTDHEPESLVIATTDHRAFKLKLPEDSVFEDREPRIVDIDGVDMVIAVRTYLKKGAALALVAIVDKQIAIVAETPPIGAPFKWLNPIGPANFAGDGILQIALVRTPHIDGELQLWTARNGQMVQTVAIDDVCNHVVRSPFVKLHAIADFNGDGIPDLAVPSQDRRRIRFFSFRGGRAREIGQAELPSAAAEDFKVVMKEGRPAVQVGLGGGRSVIVAP